MREKEGLGEIAIAVFIIAIIMEIWLIADNVPVESLLSMNRQEEPFETEEIVENSAENILAVAKENFVNGDYTKAKKYCEESLDLIESGQDSEELLVEGYLLQADIYCALGDYDKIIEILNEEIKLIDSSELREKRLDILAHHMIAKITCRDSDGNLQYQMEYDEESNTAECRYFYNGTASYYEEKIYSQFVSDNGQRTNQLVHENFYNMDGEKNGQNDYSYELINDRFYCNCVQAYDATGQLSGKVIWIFDNDGRKMGEECYDSAGNLEYKEEYRYDDNGKRIGRVWYDNRGNIESKEEYCYDENGYVVTEQYDELNELLGRIHYRYDEFGNEIESVGYYISGTFAGREQHVYNMYGDITWHIYEKAEDEFNSEETYEYEYLWQW